MPAAFREKGRAHSQGCSRDGPARLVRTCPWLYDRSPTAPERRSSPGAGEETSWAPSPEGPGGLIPFAAATDPNALLCGDVPALPGSREVRSGAVERER